MGMTTLNLNPNGLDNIRPDSLKGLSPGVPAAATTSLQASLLASTPAVGIVATGGGALLPNSTSATLQYIFSGPSPSPQQNKTIPRHVTSNRSLPSTSSISSPSESENSIVSQRDLLIGARTNGNQDSRGDSSGQGRFTESTSSDNFDNNAPRRPSRKSIPNYESLAQNQHSSSSNNNNYSTSSSLRPPSERNSPTSPL